jgi:flagellar FliL protein
MAEEEVVEVPEPKKKSRRTLWLIIVAAVVLMSAGGFLVKNYLKPTDPVQPVVENKNSITDRVKSTMDLDSFLVNLADEESTRFVKVTFRLGLNESNLGEELKGNPVVLSATRDTIISLLSTKKAEELLSIEGKKRLREEIRERVNPILPEGEVVEVFIMEFVIQL